MDGENEVWSLLRRALLTALVAFVAGAGTLWALGPKSIWLAIGAAVLASVGLGILTRVRVRPDSQRATRPGASCSPTSR